MSPSAILNSCGGWMKRVVEPFMESTPFFCAEDSSVRIAVVPTAMTGTPDVFAALVPPPPAFFGNFEVFCEQFFLGDISLVNRSEGSKTDVKGDLSVSGAIFCKLCDQLFGKVE